MKVRVIGLTGLCDATAVRANGHFSVKIVTPAGEEAWADKESFRSRVKMQWATAAERKELFKEGYIDEL
jgi:hypothetical protein